MLAQALLQSECPASITQKESSWTENVNTQLKQGDGEECTPLQRRVHAGAEKSARRCGEGSPPRPGVRTVACGLLFARVPCSMAAAAMSMVVRRTSKADVYL